VRARPELCIFADRTIDVAITRASFWLGLPEFVFLVVMVTPDAITIGLLAPLGVTIVAAYRALTVVNDLMWAFPGSLGEATQIVVGQRLGASDVAGARDFVATAVRTAVVLCSGAGLFVAVLAKPLAFLFTLNWTLAALAAGPLALHMLTSPLKGYGMAALAPIRAAGDTRFSMWLGLLTGSIGLGGIALGVAVLHIALWAVPLAWVAAWSVRCIVTALRLRTGDWEVRRLAV
jgi:Na+-driven multidrug efflux pump